MSDLPIAFEPTPQRTGHDCAVACLRMLLEAEYLDTINAFSNRTKVQQHGASDRQILNAAKKLGHTLRFIIDGDLSETVGILQVKGPTKEIHVVILAKGTVYDPGPNLFWTDVAAFLAVGKYKVCGVFVREDS